MKILAGLFLILGACVSASGDPPPLAEDAEQPVLALFEHVLVAHFAALGANPPTTCVSLRPGPLSAEQEEALIARFVRLAPKSRCQVAAETAQTIEVYEFACRTPTQCTGWVSAPGAPARRYAMSFESGAWRFTADPRLIAE